VVWLLSWVSADIAGMYPFINISSHFDQQFMPPRNTWAWIYSCRPNDCWWRLFIDWARSGWKEARLQTSWLLNTYVATYILYCGCTVEEETMKKLSSNQTDPFFVPMMRLQLSSSSFFSS
jgi:hypothetical protein